MRFVALLFTSLAIVAGCTSSPTDPPVAAPSESPPPTAGDDAADAAPPPPKAPHPAPPQVVSNGGPVVAAPHVVPVFFAGDALQPQLEQLLAAFPGSSYWHDVTSEYGVGAVTVGASIVSDAPPPTTDDALASWLATQPGIDASTVFAVFFPSSVELTIHGKKSCSVFDGYHKDARSTAGTSFVYTPIMRCLSGAEQLDAVTKAASHEIVEAVTDPLYYWNPAFSSADPDHAAWTLATVGEVADMCELEGQDGVRTASGFLVQRSWSNAAAAAGRDPCVPSAGGPYFVAAPVLTDDVPVEMGVSATTKGVLVPVGESRTIDVALLGEPGASSWTVEARDGSTFFGGGKELDLTLDRATGRNGDVLRLTIKSLAAGSYGGGSVFALVSKQGSSSHVALGFVAN